MIIHVNGKGIDVPGEITMEELVRQKGLNPNTVVIEHNLNLIKREDWGSVIIKESDSIEILRFVGGG
ncbi:MAG: thiamine biosynthesis protein ThiS [Peptococcaceae bacterium BICA1-7]|nr:MAG: thiamine biosynthesis protein ThiS [Peptococcaceae bacterium BICA1-7]HBV98261.1 thiamine biosynthesis protein ThiS [Desulfotomaculum sp.]